MRAVLLLYDERSRTPAEAAATTTSGAVSQVTRRTYTRSVTRDEADQEASRRNSKHPERAVYHWLARSDHGDEWSIVKVPRAPGARIDPLKATTEAKPRPPQGDDPRPGDWQRIPPY